LETGRVLTFYVSTGVDDERQCRRSGRLFVETAGFIVMAEEDAGECVKEGPRKRPWID
jgi:hypothetical protein